MSSALNNTHFNSSSCWTKVIESQWTDAALTLGFVALAIIGITASTGAFNAIGTTNVSYLSYGIYGGGAVFFIAEGILLIFRYRGLIKPLNADEIALLKLTVSDFVKTSHYPNKQELEKSITDILEHPDFQKNPSSFMSTWPKLQNSLTSQTYNFFSWVR